MLRMMPRLLTSRFVRRPTVIAATSLPFGGGQADEGSDDQMKQSTVDDDASAAKHATAAATTATSSSFVKVSKRPSPSAVNILEFDVPPAPTAHSSGSGADALPSTAELESMSSKAFFLKFVLPKVPEVPTALSILAHRIPFWRMRWKRLRSCFAEFENFVELNAIGTLITAKRKTSASGKLVKQQKISVSEFVTRVVAHIPPDGISLSKLEARSQWKKDENFGHLLDVILQYSDVVDVGVPDGGNEPFAFLRHTHSAIAKRLAEKATASEPATPPMTLHETETSDEPHREDVTAPGEEERQKSGEDGEYKNTQEWFECYWRPTSKSTTAITDKEQTEEAIKLDMQPPKDLSTHVIETQEAADAAAVKISEYLATNFVIGMQVKWANDRMLGAKKASLLQIATPSDAYLFRLRRTPGDLYEPEITAVISIPDLLKQALANPGVLKAAFGIEQLTEKLHDDCGVEPHGCIDIQQLLLFTGYPVVGSRGLLASALTLANYEELNELPSMPCSDWEADTLSKDQAEYAAKSVAFTCCCCRGILDCYDIHSRSEFEQFGEELVAHAGIRQGNYLAKLQSRNILLRLMSLITENAPHELNKLPAQWSLAQTETKKNDLLREKLQEFGVAVEKHMLPCHRLQQSNIAREDELSHLPIDAENEEAANADSQGDLAAITSASRPKEQHAVAGDGGSDASSLPNRKTFMQPPPLPVLPQGLHTATSSIHAADSSPAAQQPQREFEERTYRDSFPVGDVLAVLTDEPRPLEDVAESSHLSLDEVSDWCASHPESVMCQSFDASITLLSRIRDSTSSFAAAETEGNRALAHGDREKEMPVASLDEAVARVSPATCLAYDHCTKSVRICHPPQSGDSKDQDHVSLSLMWRIIDGSGKLTLVDIADQVVVQCGMLSSRSMSGTWCNLIASPQLSNVHKDASYSITDEATLLEELPNSLLGNSAAQEARKGDSELATTAPVSDLFSDVIAGLRSEVEILKDNLRGEKALTAKLEAELRKTKQSRNDFIRDWVFTEKATAMHKELAASFQRRSSSQRNVQATARLLRKHLKVSSRTEKMCRKLLSSIYEWETARVDFASPKVAEDNARQQHSTH